MPHAMPGATGGAGCHVLTWAVDGGHSVHAVARNPQALHPAAGLTVIRGEGARRRRSGRDQPETVARILKDAR
jgi:putative NADH-flavin reductase